MIRFAIALILIALVSWGLSFFMPWWSFAIPALFIPLFMKLSPGKGFVSAALGVGLLWLIIIVMRNSANEGILSGRMAELFGLGSSTLMILTSILPGIVVAGIFGLSGAGMRTAFAKKRRRR